MDFKKVNIQELQLNHQLDVNPANGGVTGNVEIPLTAGRTNFGPGLSLVYSSSSRNSVFGIGWSLSGIPFIAIDTKEGLPKYDGTERYTFCGGQSLVPVLEKSGSAWIPKAVETAEYWVYPYRPKVEEAFIRFEKWVRKDNHAAHWRTMAGDGMVSVYGVEHGKMANPENGTQVFTWLLEEQYDGQGNAVWFRYKNENADNVDAQMPSEYHRIKKAATAGFAQKYPDRILYGNSVPMLPGAPVPPANKWLFEVVFDYGEYAQRPYETTTPTQKWAVRLDPFSAYNPGFEIRTYRLCRRILTYHNIPELSAKPSLTGVFEIAYNESRLGSTIQQLTFTGVKRDLTQGTYTEKALPPLRFTYTAPKPETSFTPCAVESNSNVPQGLNSFDTRFADLFGEGLPGILTETANNWYYKRNKGNGLFDKQETVIAKPSQRMGIYALGDFDQDGNLNLFTLQGRTAGYYEYDTRKEAWSGFTPFRNIPQVSNAKFLDVNADGFADLIVETDEKLTCFPFEGKEGFGKPFEFAKPLSNGVAYAPTLGNNLTLDYFMADMTGDGLPDQVRIKNGRAEYFPNLGNGRFGESVLMDNAPVIDFDNGFDASRIRLFDLDGSGTADLLYLGRGEIRYWYNASGNGFVEGGRIAGLPYIDLLSSAQILDLLGDGTPCLVWSNSLSYAAGSAMQYLKLTGGEKPRLMRQLDNGMGCLTQIIYGFSGAHYLEAQRKGNPWISKIPSHFTVADQKVVIDTVTNNRMATTYQYYDGHYNGHDHHFVCFGRVEQYDVETLKTDAAAHDTGYTQPSCKKTWLHPGLFGWDAAKATQYYRKDGNQPSLPPPFFEDRGAQGESDFMQGYRSLAGKVVRQEVYGVKPDGELEEHPYTVTQTNYAIRNLQPATAMHEGCWHAYQTERLEIAYDRTPDDPKVAHHLALEVDGFGNIGREMNVAYARRATASNVHPLQATDYITVNVHRYLIMNTADRYHTGVRYESESYEADPIARNANELLRWGDVTVLGTKGQRTGWSRTYFWNDTQTAVLPLGQMADVVLAHHEEAACFDDALIDDAFAGKVTAAMLSQPDEGNYNQQDGYWWQRTAINHFNGASGFYSLNKVESQPGAFTTYQYDSYFLCTVEITDPLGNKTKGAMDYNYVEPYRLTDANDNVTEVLYDALGVSVVATYHGTVLHNGADERYGHAAIDAYSPRNDDGFDQILANPELYLQNMSTFLHYDLHSVPLRSIRLTNESLLHDGKGHVNTTPSIQIDLDYQDGFGRIIQNKRKVEPGPALQRKPDGTLLTDAHGAPVSAPAASRWLVSGHVVYNNKQLPVRQFEPFHSATHAFEDDTLLESYGVSIQQFYDAVGRLYRTDFPDATFSETLFSPWEVRAFDQHDTIERSLYKTFKEVHPVGTPERMALDKSLAHKDTPAISHFDPLGREIVHIETNNDGTVRKTETNFDNQGNPLRVSDARGLTAFTYKRDMLGRLLHEYSMDAGERWTFHNNNDQTIHLWDGRGVHQRTRYDALDRVTQVHVDGALGLDHTTERFIYGENSAVAQAKQKNLRGSLVLHYDQAGVQELKLAAPGMLPLHTERKLLSQFTGEPDWSDPAAVGLSPEVYASSYEYDGLGRPIEQRLPDHTTRTYVFNQGGTLQKVRLSTADGVLNDVEILKNASYDAKGMRQQALLGNNVEIAYSYDNETFRLTRLRSGRTGGAPRTYQDIRYTYDPMGNLVHLVDEAQQAAAVSPRVMEGLNVSAHSEFEYDALYQLISATGRVHQGLLQHDYADRRGNAGVPPDWAKGTRHITLNNGAAVERYTRLYAYDEGGNIKSIKHTGVSQNWTRQIWTSASSNRSLPLLDLNGTAVANPESRFDANGNCIYLPHLRNLEWNYRNNIAKAVIIDRAAQGKPNDEEYYVYGSNGMRVRKISQRVVDVANGTVELTEKIYLDGCEIKRITRGGTEILKCFTSAISGGTDTLARLYTWEKDTQARETDDITQKKIHYQLANHLGSSALELDENGDVITYEEYFPYGGTSFMAGRNKRDIDLKAYRYSGKERDDVTGLYYFGYRYYAHWMGSWINPDPIGPKDSMNLYGYVHNNPINVVDPNGLQSAEVNVRMLSTPAALPQELRETAASSGHVFFVEGMPADAEGNRYDYSFADVVAYAREHGSEIMVFDNASTALFTTFWSDSSDQNYEAYRTLMYAIEAGLEEEYSDVDFVIGWHQPPSGIPEYTDESPDRNGDERSQDTVNPGDGSGRSPAGTGSGNDPAGTGTGGSRGGTGTRPATGQAKVTGTGRTGGRGTGTPTGKANGTGNTNEADGKGGTGGSTGGHPGGSSTGSTNGNALQGTETGGSANGAGGNDTTQNNGSPNGSPTGNSAGSDDGTGDGNGGPGKVDWGSPAGGNPNITDEEPAWWQRALMAMAGAVYSIANIFIEAGKQVYDMVGLGAQCFGIATGWYEYEHEVASGIGMAAEQGQSTGDIFRNMGRGIIETPGRAWDAAERGDWFGFGSESMNLYMLGRGGYSAARGGASFAFNRSVGALGRLGPRGVAWRASIRNWQVQRIGAAVNRRLNLRPTTTWRYGGEGRAYGSYSRTVGAPELGRITINEGSFTPSLTHRLPSLRGPYAFYTRLGISRLLRGRSSYTTPMHEGWHAAQHLRHTGWFEGIPRVKGGYNRYPHEFTQGLQPMMGAHNFAFRFAPPSDFSIFFGLFGSANNNTGP